MHSPKPPEIPGFAHLTPIGTGGFSRVYRAQQMSVDRQVAVKVLGRSIDDAQARNGFERECHAMGRVRHPNIVTVFDTAFSTAGEPCIVMEYFGRGTWGDSMRDGAIQVEQAVDMGIRLADALHIAHQAGIIHRDIKPQNVFVSEYGQPALGDFGISAFDDDKTHTGSGAWTLHYVAPEVFDGAPFSQVSDVYSLSATLYTALAGHRPFDDPAGSQSSEAAVIKRLLQDDPPPLTNHGLPAAVDHIIREKGLAKSPALRHASAEELASDLQRLQREMGWPVTPRPSLGRTDSGAAAKPPALPRRPTNYDPTDEHSTVRRDTPQPKRPVATPGGERAGRGRRRWVMVGALAAITALLVGALGLGLLDDADTTEQVAPDPAEVQAPTLVDRSLSAPRNLTMARSEENSAVTVSWDGPTANGEVLDVEFIVERTDVDDAGIVTTPKNLAKLDRIGPEEPVCVVVRALSSEAMSPPSDPLCVDNGQPVEPRLRLIPGSCPVGPCTVRLLARNLPARAIPWTVEIVTTGADPVDVNEAVPGSYATEVTANDRSWLDWTWTPPPSLAPGSYTVHLIASDNGQRISAELELD